ncbi:SDR family oxidoreductase [Rhizobiaceae bacterium BDR2-2]|uniref:SDR family oxidoreductase n=1 Tax=Ectorhizobium quercum TaxID=2965071 RepID=A0AAE3MZ18_9HYPH|nr:SDR family oxidoreductase [Ectorhizobium quercum]MCX8996987.1 SDR family oxidoreductase [Ectorhizobium quercum]
MDLNLKDRTALVTGASAGIGAGIARALAAEGVRIAITARRGEPLERLAAEIEAGGGQRPLVLTGDVTDASTVSSIVSDAAGTLGGIDILVNSAGGSRPVPLDASEEVWDEAFALNFHAIRRFAAAVLPSMQERRWGRIVNISGSMEPRALNAAMAAKAALHLWAKGLACDVAADGITVNTIAPGRINSEQILTKMYPTEEARQRFIAANIPIGYFGDPEDIAHLVAFLVSPLARYITGAVIPVDGAMRFSAH